MSACPAGGDFLFWQKRKSPKKVARERERVRAERPVGPSLRWALGTWICWLVAMPVAGWCYRSFANSFTLCLIFSFVLQPSLAVSCPFFSSIKTRRQVTAISEKNPRGSTATDSPAHTQQARKQKKWRSRQRRAQRKPVSQLDQAEREAVGERAVAPASHRHRRQPPIKEPRAQRSDGPSERPALIRSRPQGNFLG